jgi:hypothetical protein
MVSHAGVHVPRIVTINHGSSALVGAIIIITVLAGLGSVSDLFAHLTLGSGWSCGATAATPVGKATMRSMSVVATTVRAPV